MLKKNRTLFVYILKFVQYWRFFIGLFPANHGSAFSYK